MNKYSQAPRRVLCPHCKSAAATRTSKPLSELSREIYYQCTNPECGHTWVSLLSAIRTIVPSRTPNPNVHIPLSEKTGHTVAMETAPPSG